MICAAVVAAASAVPRTISARAIGGDPIYGGDPQNGGKTGSIHGIVIMPNGAQLAQASVSAKGAKEESATTSGRGEYRIGGLPVGVYKVKVTAAGFEPFEIQIRVEAGADAEADAVLTA